MADPQVRADYDQLKKIQEMFSAQADCVSQTSKNLTSRMGQLEKGDWIGEGARKFYQEMNDQVLPTMKRLQQALEQAAKSTATISQTMKTAEDEASGILHI